MQFSARHPEPLLILSRDMSGHADTEIRHKWHNADTDVSKSPWRSKHVWIGISQSTDFLSRGLVQANEPLIELSQEMEQRTDISPQTHTHTHMPARKHIYINIFKRANTLDMKPTRQDQKRTSRTFMQMYWREVDWKARCRITETNWKFKLGSVIASFPPEFRYCCISHGLVLSPSEPRLFRTWTPEMVEHVHRSPIKFPQVNIHFNTTVLELSTLQELQAQLIPTIGLCQRISPKLPKLWSHHWGQRRDSFECLGLIDRWINEI